MTTKEPTITYVNCDAETWFKTVERPHIQKRFIPSSRSMDIDYKLGGFVVASKTSIYTRGQITAITCVVFKGVE